MTLGFIGIDPDTGKSGSPTVWVEEETADLIFQGITADDELVALVSSREWAPGHDAGIPAHETVVRIPARLVPIIRKACDAAERAQLRGVAERRSDDSGTSGDA
ncbi:hypothetical protein [Kitasatospora sp. NPDC059827]|uniref:hypothetical protein n=1 Tax=Kitasatospora sp. NPDC059827 TaxID=3346964 RepID=UPI00365DD0BF